MPTTNRDELIADWHKRLAAASQASVEPSSRAAWLARLRLRLYRFLISLYGEGQWHGSKGLENDQANRQVSPIGGEVITREGKPAKDAGKIREALAAFAKARTNTNVPGPLADGQGDEAWVMVASIGGGLHPECCAGVLRAAGIAQRIVNRVGDITVEVRAKNASQANRIIASAIDRLRKFDRRIVPVRSGLVERAIATIVKWIERIPPRWKFAFVSLVHVALTVPLAWISAALVFSLESPAVLAMPTSEDDFREQFWTTLRGFLVVSLLLIWLRADWEQRRKKQAEMSARRVARIR